MRLARQFGDNNTEAEGTQEMSLPGGRMNYVICHKCGDPVAGRLPSGHEERQLECARGHERFEFTDSEIRSGIVMYDDVLNRWKVASF